MCLAVALDLGGLVQRLPARAGLGVLLRDRLAGEGIDFREHDAVRQVAVMRDRKELAAGLVLVGLQVFPQVLRVVAADRADRRVGLDLACLVAAVAQHHDAVQVVAARVRGPLEADECRELVRLVVGLRCLDGDFPGVAISLRTRQRSQRLRESALRERVDDFGRDATASSPPFWISSYQRLPVGSARYEDRPRTAWGKSPCCQSGRRPR